jgi:isocitrate lyase
MTIPTTPLLPPWVQSRAAELEAQWATDPRWAGLERSYSSADVLRLRNTSRDAARAIVRRIDDALLRADRIALAEAGKGETDWLAALVADAESGPGGHVVAFQHARALIDTGAPEIRLSDRRRAPWTSETMVVSSSQQVRVLNAARLAADVAGVATTIVARTEARAATLLTTDADDRDRAFLTGSRSREGFARVRSDIDSTIARGLTYASHADVVELVTSVPDLAEARRFADAILAWFPRKRLVYDCPSPGSATEGFRRELLSLGYAVRLPVPTHSVDHSSSVQKEEQFA